MACTYVVIEIINFLIYLINCNNHLLINDIQIKSKIMCT